MGEQRRRLSPSKVRARRQNASYALSSVFCSPSLFAAYDLPSSNEPLATSCRPLNSITPLDPESLHRIPLSTPPRTPPPGETEAAAVAREVESQAEKEFPLILVTGESCSGWRTDGAS